MTTPKKVPIKKEGRRYAYDKHDLDKWLADGLATGKYLEKKKRWLYRAEGALYGACVAVIAMCLTINNVV